MQKLKLVGLGIVGTAFLVFHGTTLATEPAIPQAAYEVAWQECNEILNKYPDVIKVYMWPKVHIYHKHNLPSKINLGVANAINPDIATHTRVKYAVTAYDDGNYSGWLSKLTNEQRQTALSTMLEMTGNLAFRLPGKKFYTVVRKNTAVKFMSIEDPRGFQNLKDKVGSFGFVPEQFGQHVKLKDPKATARIVDKKVREATAKKLGVDVAVLDGSVPDGFQVISWNPKTKYVPVKVPGCDIKLKDIEVDRNVKAIWDAKIFSKAGSKLD